MRRKEKEIVDQGKIKNIIKQAHICNIAMCRDNVPYIVTMNFGFDGEYIYLHSAAEGLKLDILKENPRVCIGIVQNTQFIPALIPCSSTMLYDSVLILGRVDFLSARAERINALKCIMEHYYKGFERVTENELKFEENDINKLAIIRVKIEKMTAKHSV